MFNIEKTDDVMKKISIGEKIVSLWKDVYTDDVIKNITEIIRRFPDKCVGSEKDTFFLSVYDYWLYGVNTAEEFYLDFINKKNSEKEEYITHMDRLNYMHFLNKREDEHLLANKYETYNLIPEYFKREVIFVKDETDYGAFHEFCSRHKSFVVKPVGLAISLGVKKVEFGNRDDLKDVFHSIINEVNELIKDIKWATVGG